MDLLPFAPMADNTIEGKQYVLGEVFGEQFVFRIPNYQRPYAWGTEQTEELLDDLFYAMGPNENTSADQLSPYFLGSIVLIKPAGTREADIIDGQQRITTLSLLFAALRNTLQDKELADNMSDCLVQKGNRARGIKDQPRLMLRDIDAAFFRDEIQSREGLKTLLTQETELDTEAKAHLRENAKLLVARLAALSEVRRAQLATYLLQRSLMVVVTTDNRASAVRIFSVLNSRGLDLLTSDILKPELIDSVGLSGNELSEFTQNWEKVEESLGRDVFQEFFAHVRMIHVRKRAEKELLEEFRKLVLPSDPAARLAFVTKGLFEFAHAFEQVQFRNYKSSDPTANEASAVAVFWLQYVDNFDWVPSAILAFQRLQQKPSLLADALSSIERLAASMMIRRCGVDARVRRFAEALGIIGQNFAGSAGTRLELDAKERQQTLDCLNGDVYTAHRNVQRLILCRLDDAIASAPPPAASKTMRRSLTVEHVLPQTVNFTDTTAGKWGAWYTQTQHAATVHKLGNLALLTRNKNSQASNSDFATKKAKYFQGTGGVTQFALTVQVLAENTWDSSVFQKHQTQRVQKLKDVWKL
jgi:hypothetical protein